MHTGLNKLLLVLFWTFSFGFGTPMEPAKSTLFILLDGMNPSNTGILNSCSYYEDSDTWGKTGAAKFFQENIANTKANIYSRQYLNPAEAPSEMIEELAGRGINRQTVNCQERTSVYNANMITHKLGDKMKVGSIIDEALEHWYAEMLNEAQLVQPITSYQGINLQKSRNAWNYNGGVYSPKGQYSAGFANINHNLQTYINNFKATRNVSPSLADLKKERPDLLPSRYVFIANGMGGMVAREYVQGADYQDDVDKILFINTPHEGTGFADQALLTKDPMYDIRGNFNKIYTAAIAAVSLVYLLSDDALQDSLITVTKVLLQSITAMLNVDGMNDFFYKQYDKEDGALWYLAQDADKRDLVYAPILDLVSLSKVDTLIGSAQLLNSVGMVSGHNDPMYRIMYSYGMPTYGNGRRARADYLFQKKTHWNEEKLDQLLIKTFENQISKSITKQIGEGASELLGQPVATFSRWAAKKLLPTTPEEWAEWQKTFGTEHSSGVLNFIENNITDKRIASAVNAGVREGLNFLIDYGLGELMEYIDISAVMDDIPDELVNLLSILVEVLPNEFTQKFVSSFIFSYSPKYHGMQLASNKCSYGSLSIGGAIDLAGSIVNGFSKDYQKDCTFSGQADVARTMVNYSVNFFDQGTVDVPTHSAYGGSAQIFNGTDVKRIAYPLHTIDLGDERYDSFRRNLVNDGFLESNRATLDGIVGFGCSLMKKSYPVGYEICTITRFATNLAIMGAQMSDIFEIVSGYDVLNQTRDMALRESLLSKHSKEVELPSGDKVIVKYTDMDNMLYEAPMMGLQIMVDGEGENATYVPMMFGQISGKDYRDVPEIKNYTDLKSLFANKDAAINPDPTKFDITMVLNQPISVKKLEEKTLATDDDYYTMALRGDVYNVDAQGTVNHQIVRMKFPSMIVKHEIQEYRFKIDDLRPDLLWSISLDFNLDVQFRFERHENGTWDVFLEGTGHKRTYVEKNSPFAPVDENGLFVFRPMEILAKANVGIADVAQQYTNNKVQCEGPNLVTVSMTNAVGLSASQQFSFFYESTKPNLTEGWPRMMQTVSALNEMFVSASNIGYPYKFIEKGSSVHLIKVDNGRYIDVPGTEKPVHVEHLSSSEKGEWYDSWYIKAEMGENFLKDNNISDGEYIVQWNLKTVNSLEEKSDYKMNVNVFIDTKAPDISLVSTKEKLSNTSRDGAWATLYNNEKSAIRAARIYIVPEESNAIVPVQNIYGFGLNYMDLKWGEAIDKLSTGKAKAYVQAIDYAEPNDAIASILNKLSSEDSEIVNNAWKELLDGDGEFKKGINVNTESIDLYIDKQAPSIKGDVSIASVFNANAKCDDCPQWNASNQANEEVLNSYNFLKLSFQLDGEDESVNSNVVRVQLIFSGEGSSPSRSYVYDHDFKAEEYFVFEENENKMLPDGKYAVTIVLTDAAGNSNGNQTIAKSIRVDRTSPNVKQIITGEPVYANVGDVDKAFAVVSSAADLDINMSALTCYQKISDGKKSSNWTYINDVPVKLVSQGNDYSLPYSLKNSGMNLEKGRYAAYVGCYDVAGNFNKNAEVFGLGNRYPSLTYPKNGGMEPIKDQRYIRIEGIAPDPIVPGGNIQTAEYKIEWRKAGDDKWKSDGIRYTGKTVSSLIENLAIWDRNGLAGGTYEIALSVRGCRIDSCTWVGDTITVDIADIDDSDEEDMPRIDLKYSLSSQVPGEEPNVISAQLLGVSSGNKWDMNLKIYASDPYDKTRMIVAESAYLDSMIISPFAGVVADVAEDGMYIGQDNDGVWTIKYVGAASPSEGYANPILSLKYDFSNFEIVSAPTAKSGRYLYADHDQYSEELVIGAGKGAEIRIPAYNYSSEWTLADGSNDFVLKFKTSKPFIIDASAIAHVNSRMHCGGSQKLCSEYFMNLNNKNPETGEETFSASLLSVYPDAFKLNLKWNGLTKSNLYPSTGKVKAIAFATERNSGNKVVIDSVEWNMVMGLPKIITNYVEKGRLVVQVAEDKSVIELGEIPFEFGVGGRNAKISAVVKNSDGKIVKHINIANANVIAGSQKNTVLISWDGANEDNFLAANAGDYYFEVTAVDEENHVATYKYPFEIVYAGQLMPAEEDAAILLVDEANPKVESDGSYRFAAKADYNLTAKVKALTLDQHARKFEYYWDYQGVQHPAFYRANRFSLGIRRQRESFPVTLVTMMHTWQYYLNYTTGWERANHCEKYRITVDTVRFHLDDGHSGQYTIENMRLEGGDNHIVGYDYADGKKIEHIIYFEAKVFDRKDYGKIVRALGLSGGKDVQFCVDTDKDRNLKPSDDDYYRVTAFDNSFSSEKAVNLWNSGLKKFRYSTPESTLDFSGDPGKVTIGCLPNEQNGFVCDEETTSEFKPHKNMLDMAIRHVDGSSYFGDKKYTCMACENDNSAQNIFAKVIFQINPSYWEPAFGYNNLANKYVRFDHTNKTLYDPGNFFSKSLDKNFYNGDDWVHSSHYGLVTAFEAQRFTYNSGNYANNALNFPDEKYPEIKSKYHFQFMDGTEKSFKKNGEDDALPIKFKAFVEGHVTTFKFSSFSEPLVVTQEEKSLSIASDQSGIQGFDRWIDASFSVTVAPLISAQNAIVQNKDVSVPYPMKSDDYNPRKFGNIDVCDESSRLTDDSENHCYRYYQGPSRIHYGLNDWNSDDWNARFTYNGYIVNPLNTDGRDIRISEKFDIGNGKETQYQEVKVVKADYDVGKRQWILDRASRFPHDVDALKNVYETNPPSVKPVLKIKNESEENGWKIALKGDDVEYVYNEGTSIEDDVSYIRAKDDTQDNGEFERNATREISANLILDQNQDSRIARNDWIENLTFSNPLVLDRSNNGKHDYFDAELNKAADAIIVKRSDFVPGIRVPEMITLRGRVPGAKTQWSLSYSQGGTKMIPIAEGVQETEPNENDLPVMAMKDVNTLQGNTTFILMYGIGDAARKIYYKKLNLHIGEYLDASEGGLIQSMYHNVSVSFPKKAFNSDKDVTVRTINLTDNQYNVFEGLDPVGPIVEVLPSYVFDQDNEDSWPRVYIEISRSTLEEKHQNPLEVRIYKPDYISKVITPLEIQEIGFFNKGDFVKSCGDESKKSCDAPPSEWDAIRVSGLTKTFSDFLVMDKNKALLVKPTEEKPQSSPEFACEEGQTFDGEIWAGIVNGHLNYPYPCVGESNYMLQLNRNGDVVAEKQGATESRIQWEMRKGDILTKLTYEDVLKSRLALYGNNGKNLQFAGPNVRVDASLPVIESTSIEVEDYELQKRVVVDVNMSDAESGIDTVHLDFYWGGELVEKRVEVGNSSIAEDFLLTKKMVGKCVGCKLEVTITAHDYGHNYVQKKLVSETIYPFPKSLVLWYPLAEGAGTVAREAMGTGIDLNLVMSNPWTYGSSLNFSKVGDVAKPSKIWDGVGTVPMSVELRIKSGVSRTGTEFSILGWKGSKDWNIGLKDAQQLFFEFNGQRLVFSKANVKRGVEIHYVLTVDGQNVRLYRDGSLVEEKHLSTGFAWISEGSPIAGTISSYNSVSARLSGVRFYQAELNEDQVKDLYRGDVDVVDANIMVTRAVDLSDRNNLIVDQSCDLAGMAYLRQKNPVQSGSVTWNVTTNSGRYDLFMLSRGYNEMSSAVEILVDGSSMGSYDINRSGVWMSQQVDGLTLNLTSGAHNITIKPIGYTGIAAFAIAKTESAVPASMITWNENEWSIPKPKVQVEIAYPAYSDKTWMRANIRLKNITDKSLDRAKLRYYYSGEDNLVSAKSFDPDANMGVYVDAGDVFYAELQLTEPIRAHIYPYYGKVHQIGMYRTNNNAPWNFDDDPSFDAKAVDGAFHETDKVAVLDEDGNLISNFSCYDATGPATIKTPSVRVLALDERGSSNEASTIAMAVENVGKIPIYGFEVRYFIRDSKKPLLDVYSNPFANTPELFEAGNELYFVSFKYDNVILNPGEASDYGLGVKFTLHHDDWQDWDVSDDASHYGLSYEFTQADSIVVLDQMGNLLWGGVPKAADILPEISGDDNYGNIITIVSEEIIVDVPADGKYVLERVNAIGITQETVYTGYWSAGEHTVSTDNMKMISGQYLVLRNGSTIVSRVTIK